MQVFIMLCQNILIWMRHFLDLFKDFKSSLLINNKQDRACPQAYNLKGMSRRGKEVMVGKRRGERNIKLKGTKWVVKN